ncbi:hypothetical protein O6H91_06G122900 [Diphasiastrum complanatum]|uniref:Uncharacterized protein n=2 Tax=Diphasiastrum complanatum TaxID=34168 RepID=A0ACC2DIB0_DIPCM|nr:hypothetical protein O6H91_06G122200 [Diphasiastrum complanatum]KAJ7554022.1 hypothetical protein O6H91_06G122900 [Diphasiastrum complanatum]
MKGRWNPLCGIVQLQQRIITIMSASQYKRVVVLPSFGIRLRWMTLAMLMILVLNSGLSNVEGGSFQFQNLCSSTVWIGSQSNAGQPVLPAGSVALKPGAATSVSTPSGWGGRFWGRTGCQFDSSGQGSCSTGDCGGTLQCTGMGGSPPATLAEFTLNGANGKDYYDVSLVDGYNLPISVAPSRSSGSSSVSINSSGSSSSSTPSCGVAGCTGDLNESCPSELQLQAPGGQVIACKSACEAYGTAQYCCTGTYSSPATCPPTTLSQTFKAACPNAYSYAYDDASSIYTCTGGSYIITFCPRSSLNLM